ncbi:MAG: DUF6879 family protein [Pseudonocardiaceae bacterium]
MRLDTDAWRQLIASVASSAFRLETLAVYDMPSEREEFARHVAGEKPPTGLHYCWLDTVAKGVKMGKSFQRVHVVASPLSDYLTYEFTWGYVFNVKAGEDIRILDLAHQADPGLPTHDFWLLDQTTVVRMDYDEHGVQLGRELLEDVDPAPYVAGKNLALEHAEPFERYYAQWERTKPQG